MDNTIVILGEWRDGPSSDGGWMGTGWRDARLWDRGLRMLEDTSMNTLTFHEYQSVRSNMNRLLCVVHSTAMILHTATVSALNFTSNFEFPSNYLSGILRVLPFGENLIFRWFKNCLFLELWNWKKIEIPISILILLCTKSISVQIEDLEICFRCDMSFPTIAACKNRR